MASLLRSKWFWGFSTLTGAVFSAKRYDTLETEKIKASFLAKCREYDDLPLNVTEMPRKLAIICVEPSYPEVLQAHRKFKSFALPLLNAAGIDHDWIEVSRKQQLKDFDALIEKKRTSPDVPLEGEAAEKEDAEKFIAKFPYFEYFGHQWSQEMNVRPVDYQFEKNDQRETIQAIYKKPLPSSTLFKDGIVFLTEKEMSEFCGGVEKADCPKKPAVTVIDLQMSTGFLNSILKAIILIFSGLTIELIWHP